MNCIFNVRTTHSFTPDTLFLEKALQYADKESHVIYLNPNEYQYPHEAFKHVLAFGKHKDLTGEGSNDFENLQKFLSAEKDWAFGYLTYELKNQLESLTLKTNDLIGFPTLNFFIPKHLVFISKDSIEIQSLCSAQKLKLEIEKEVLENREPFSHSINLHDRLSKSDYLKKVKHLQKLIHQGAIYETNFCQEYYAEGVELNALATYQKLNQISPMPFSCYVKHNERYLLCASPERFLKKEKNQLISQPIKGTIKRGETEEKDEALKILLTSNLKERSENIMIIDIVRNDLSKSAVAGSVNVEEICGLYSFPNVHQLISTVTATLDTTVHPIESIKQAFPMGSMTGAPKVRAMELIDENESATRGLFSGAVGYFTPDLDFDFNVVIRSILYNASTKYLSFQAGSAITFYSDAGKEYEECAVKTKAIREVLS